MRSFLLGFAACSSLFVLASPSHAMKEPIVLAPSSNWNVDFALTKCRLVRTFGEGEDKHALIIEQHHPGASAGLTVAGPRFRRFRNLRETMLSFSANSQARSTEPFKGNMGAFGPALVYSKITFAPQDPKSGPDSDPEQAAPSRGDVAKNQGQIVAQLNTQFGNNIEFFSFFQKGDEVRFTTGPLGDAFNVLNSCTQDMIKEWGFDVERQLAATRRPVWANELEIAKRIQKNYPLDALRRGESAVLRMRVTVNEAGKVEECVLDEVTDAKVLQSPACREMRRAEFEPALDANGEPMRSFYTTSITYRIG